MSNTNLEQAVRASESMSGVQAPPGKALPIIDDFHATQGSEPRRLRRGTSGPRPARGKKTEPAPSLTPEDRNDIRIGVRRAADTARTMIDAANDNDQTALAVSGAELSAALLRLSRRAYPRENQFEDLIALLLSSLASRDYETYSAECCTKIFDVIETCLRPAKIENEDIIRANRLLREGGLDPWHSLSDETGRASA